MNNKCVLRLQVFFGIVFGLSLPSTAIAIQSEDWESEARDRIHGIYELREFSAQTPEIQWLPDSSAYLIRERDSETKQDLWARYSIDDGKRTIVSKPENNRLQSPDGKQVIDIRGEGIVVRNVESKESETLIAKPQDRDISYQKVSWSPDGKFIAFVEADRTDVRMRSVLVPDDPSYPGVAQRRFARVGSTLESLRVGIVPVTGGGVKWLDLKMPAEGHYFGQVAWTPDPQKLLVESLSRFRDTRQFWLADSDGNVEQIYKETNDAWAVGSHGINSGATWINDGKQFVFISEKNGWRHAFRCNRDGLNEVELMAGDFDLIDRAKIDESRNAYYFYASPNNGTQKYLYQVPLDGSAKLVQITPESQQGTHDYLFSPDAKWAIHTWSRLEMPPKVELVELPSHRVVRTIEENKLLLEKFQDMKSSTEFVAIDIGNGIEMDASITKPSDFDESKKYPVLVYVYGEPYLQTVLDRWGAAQIDFHRVIADAGYVVVSIDNRGTACPKGAAWRRSVFGSLGPLSTEDQAAALTKLASMKSFIDLDRVAIWGWSGGGSNTLNAMFRKPDLYDVGIAVVPKPQPHLYNAWFQEIYMRTREVNADGYRRSAPINFAEGLKGKLLIITGSGETNTHIQIIEGLVDRLIELGKSFDYMVYPNRDHGLREGKGSKVHVRMLIMRYLIENLPRGPR